MTVAAPTSEIRRWARTQGMTVGDRGRLPPGILAAYAASRGQSQSPTTPDGHGDKHQLADSGNKVAVRPVPGATGSTRTISARAR